ncbi:hypothetical protein CLU79DRAFT_740951 [Phycomyces nitens]|nr:hypothetical protein CLU79DRAFT_740951 [Phycomyces nitens]
MALSAKVSDPLDGSTSLLGQDQPTLTKTPTATPISHSAAASPVPQSTKTSTIIFSSLPKAFNHTWRQSTSSHSVFFTPPPDSSSLVASFWAALTKAIPADKVIQVSFPNRHHSIHELHLTDSDICSDLCSKGFPFDNSTFYTSPGVPKGTKILYLSLTKLPFLPQPILTPLLKDALSRYGTVRELGLGLQRNYFDGTGYAYIERVSNPTTPLLQLSRKMPISETAHFFATWKQIGVHYTYCQAIGT